MTRLDVTEILRPFARAALAFGLLGVSSSGCETPAEPDARPRASAEHTVRPLEWTAPSTFVELTRSPVGSQRASYRVPPAGSDTEDGELLVLFYGTGSGGDRDKVWSGWFEQFDGDASAQAKRESFAVGPLQLETFEHVGDYKLNMGPRRSGMKRSPVQMVKKQHRMIGALVRTPDRGNWFVRLVGPDETVQAAKPALRQLLDSMR